MKDQVGFFLLSCKDNLLKVIKLLLHVKAHYFWIIFKIFFLLMYFSDYTKVMLIAGYADYDWQDDVQVIDLADPSSVCAPIANYPIAADFMVAGFINGVVKSCGGYIGSDINLDLCYDYNPSTNSWDSSPNVNYERSKSASSVIAAKWLVTGNDLDITGSKSELWTGSEFVESIDLPEHMYEHCQVTINSSHVFFGDCRSQTAYILDWNLQEWTQLGNMTYYRLACGCGLIHNDVQGDELVIASEGTSEIFNFGTMSWRDGPNPADEYGFASAQLRDTFALLGGFDSGANRYSSKVWVFDQNNYEFVLLEQRLQHHRAYGGAIAVPDEIVHCVSN